MQANLARWPLAVTSLAVFLLASGAFAAGFRIAADIDDSPAQITGVTEDAIVPLHGGLLLSGSTLRRKNALWLLNGSGEISLVYDRLPGDLDPRDFGRIGYRVLFAGYTGDGVERELWITDGLVNTTLLRDLYPGNSDPRDLTEFDGQIYFLATASTSLSALWRSDGTFDGTAEIAKFTGNARDLVASGGLLFFQVNHSVSFGFTTLWRSDGTLDGTFPLASFEYAPAELTALPDGLLFTVPDRKGGAELWASDGSPEGTARLADLRVGALRRVGDGVYFGADDGIHGSELWWTDGSAEGTFQVADIVPGEAGSQCCTPYAEVGGRWLFLADDGTHGRELWTTDGTAEGTRLLVDARPGPEDADPRGKAFSDGFLYFMAAATSVEDVLYRTDGTPEGTSVVTATSGWGDPLGGKVPLAFVGERLVLGNTLSLFDPVSLATERLEIAGSGASSNPEPLAAHGDRVFFTARDPVHGRELWVSDGTQAGTRLLADIRPGIADAAIENPVLLGSRLLFAANDGVHGTEPWITDEAGDTATLVGDLEAGPGGSASRAIVSLGDVAYLAGGRKVWRSDGTPAGSWTIFELPPPCAGCSATVKHLIAAGDRLFFFTLESAEAKLWASDGTISGTRPMASWSTEVLPSAAPQATVDGKVFFPAWDPEHGVELWVSDGTPEGTSLVADLAPGSHSSPLPVIGGRSLVYFRARVDGVTALWRSDGTEAGTFSIGTPSMTSATVLAEDIVLFEDGGDLWRTDGTPEGTHRIQAPVHNPSNLSRVGDRIVFQGSDDRGNELWETDGTSAGTRLLADVDPAPFGSGSPYGMIGSEGRLFFSAIHPILGRELFADAADPPACADAVDNDLDQHLDYPEDRQCTSLDDPLETGPACGLGAELPCVLLALWAGRRGRSRRGRASKNAHPEGRAL